VTPAEPTRAALEEAEGWSSLASVIEAVPQRREGSTVLLRRRPLWSAEASPAMPLERPRLMRAEAAAVLQFRNVLELGLVDAMRDGYDERATLRDAVRFRAWLTWRPAETWRRLTMETYPAWLRLLEAQEGRTSRVRQVAMLLAAATIAQGKSDPADAEFDALEGELNGVLLAHRAESEPAWQTMLDALTGCVIEPHDVTVLHEIAIAAGYGEDDGSGGLAIAAHARSEGEAIAVAKRDPLAARAVRRIGQLGFRVLGEAGYRELAIALTAPARARLMERARAADLAAEGLTVANTLLQARDARRHPGNLWFPGRGAARCIKVPLALVLERLVGPDPGGAADAWEGKPT
jgi:hypothetical protein